MSLQHLITRPCTLIRSAGTGSRNAAGNETTEEVRVETKCELQPQEATESTESIATSLETIFFLPGEEVDAGDAVEIPDEGHFEIVGEPDRRRNPRTGAAMQVRASVRRLSGVDEVQGS